jgi:hypothetical protein
VEPIHPAGRARAAPGGGHQPATAADRHRERIRHARQTTLRIASTHAKAHWATRALAGIAAFLGALTNAAEQLTPTQRWYRILSHALRHFLGGLVLKPPERLAAAPT